MVGETISHYRVVGHLGTGGMGVVYRAEDVRLGRPVALKFVSEDLAHDASAVQRLRTEARAASALNHANICTIYDIGEHAGQPFIVMELMKGRTLRDALLAGSLKVHQVVDIGIETAAALHAAHSEGIIHRDIKPGNIFLTDRGHVKILDFGLAKLTVLSVPAGTTQNVAERTAGGVTLGTVSYMSPEQASGEDLDPRTDLFSLGVVLYECATGRHPFPGKTSAVILEAILNRAPVAPVVLNPELPLRLQEVVNNCLEKDRELRYQSAADLRADLKRLRRDLESGQSRAVETRSSRSGTSTSDSSRSSAPQAVASGSRRWWVAAGVAVPLVVGAGLYATWRNEPPAPVESERVAPPPAPDPAIASRFALATASLEARDYRAAIAYAGQVLALEPTHAGAVQIRNEAQAALVRFDASIADARRRMAANDLRGAARALETAREIDARAPAIAEIASRLALQSREAESRRRPAAPTTPVTPAPQAPPRVEPQPPAPTSSSPATPETSVSAAPAPEPAAPPKPTPPPAPIAATPPAERTQPSVAPPSAEDDDAAIRRLMTTYGTAIERKDLALFRSVKPNLSAEEERRLQEGFRAVTSQQVDITILSIQKRGDEATVVLRRRDTIQAGGRQLTSSREQTLALTRTGRGWMIVDIR
jgi:serine/threonine protein kinase